MASYQTVKSPARLPARDGLLQTFKPLDPVTPWYGGIQFDPEACGQGGLIPAECNDVEYDEKVLGCCDPEGDTEVKARPHTVYSGYEVSTFNDRDLAKDRAMAAYRRCYDKIIEWEFWSGDATKLAEAAPANAADLPLYLASERVVDRRWNPIFPSSPDVTDWTTAVTLRPIEALAQAVDVATQSCNGKGVIHVPQSALTYWVSLDLVDRIEGQWRTKVGGHIVVPGRGYPGTAPDDTTLPGLAWIYVTGNVETYLGNMQSRWVDGSAGALDIRQNKRMHLVEEQSLVIFDPCVWAGIPMLLCGNACEELDVTTGFPSVTFNEFLRPGSVAGIVCAPPPSPVGGC